MLIILESKITANEIAQILDVSSRTSEKHIQKLREAHLIKRIGCKEDVWQIVKQQKTT
ncbi:HTH domain-containing protein [Gelidibacter salicanalis]